MKSSLGGGAVVGATGEKLTGKVDVERRCERRYKAAQEERPRNGIGWARKRGVQQEGPNRILAEGCGNAASTKREQGTLRISWFGSTGQQ